jgi:hypothetical protein
MSESNDGTAAAGSGTPNTPAVATESGGRGRGRGGRGGRSGGRGRSQPNAGSRSSNRQRFKGNTEGMNGHVFQTPGESKNQTQFTKTMEALAEYAAKNFEYPGDILPLFTNLTIPTLQQPADPTDDEAKSPAKMEIWKLKLKRFVEREDKLQDNLKASYAVIWGQCSEAMKAKLTSLPNYATFSKKHDCAAILKEIKAIMYRLEGETYVALSLANAHHTYRNIQQGGHESVSQYFKRFKSVVEVLEHLGASVGDTSKRAIDGLAAADPSFPDATDPDRQRTAAQDRQVAVVFLRGADPARYGGILPSLENNYQRGTFQFPRDLTAAYNMLVNYKKPPEQPPRRSNAATATPDATSPTPTADGDGVDALQFTQVDGQPMAGTDGILHAQVRCYRCDRLGHYANRCPNEDSPSHQLFQDSTESTETHFTFSQHRRLAGRIPASWVLLDSESTASVFCNPNLVHDIRPSATTLTTFSNGGFQVTRQEATVRNFGRVWFNPRSIANILSLADVRKICRITMDTSAEPAFSVHRSDGSLMKFKETENGLYVHDTADPAGSNSISPPVVDYSLLATVAAHKAEFTRREIEGADRARELYHKLGRPSQQDFEAWINKGLIRNCPVTALDAKRATYIYGPDYATLQGKTTRRSPAQHVPSFAPVPLPASILKHHRPITLCVDLFFCQSQPFFHSISRGVQFRTSMPLSSRQKEIILSAVKNTVSMYTSRGFHLQDVHGDHEFECIQAELPRIHFEICARDAHVPEVERSIRTVKERVRATCHGLPFKRLPRMVIRGLIAHATSSLNQFPNKNGISDTLSPLTIVTGRGNVDYNKLALEFGEYVLVFEDNDPTNTLKARNTPAIALNPTGNAQGDYYFMSLVTGRRLRRNKWTSLPMPTAAIRDVERIAERENQPLLEGHTPLFEWRPNHPILPLDEDQRGPDADGAGADDGEADGPADPEDGNEAAQQAADAGPATEDDHDETAPVATPTPASIIDIGDDDDDDTTDEDVEGNGSVAHENGSVADDAEGPDDDSVESNADAGEENGSVAGTPDSEHSEDEMDDAIPETFGDATNDAPQQHPRYNLRGDRERTYTHRLAHVMDTAPNSKSYERSGRDIQLLQQAIHDAPANPGKALDRIVGTILTQMSASAGIKKHGKTAIDALFREFAQLNDKSVFEGMDPQSLTPEQKKAALRAVNVIKEKRCGKIKGRTCADGRKQRQLYEKAETTSPTICTDALLMSLIIDAMEHRDVAIFDVPGAYLNADMPDFVLMKMVGQTVDIMCRVNRDWEKFVVIENGQKTLYLRLAKALYGCVKSGLLWYDLYVSKLKPMGFELNPYEPCVANAIIEGKQCTMAWYVDDNKLSHVSPDVVTMVIEKIEEHFGAVVTTRGKKHEFLGMQLEFRDDGTVAILMDRYLRQAIEDSKMDITRDAASPATKGLMSVDEQSPPLPQHDADVFHHVVALLLYVSSRARVDTQTALSFLCTRVSNPTEQDRRKLKRLLQYLRGTLHMPRVLGAETLHRMTTYVDVAFAPHPDMRSHTGGGISFGRGALCTKSTKQRINTKSTTESETVGASDYLPNTIWLANFIKAQGYEITENLFMQDNESAIKLEKNGRASAGQRTRHMDIRYFWIKDRVKQENIKITYCPTEAMLADFLTKPLQGNLFRKLRAALMGHIPLSDLTASSTAPSVERVGSLAESRLPTGGARGRTNDVSQPQKQRSQDMRRGHHTNVDTNVDKDSEG